MEVIENTGIWRAIRDGLPNTLGLVPTMGYLHEGHLSLVRRARDENSQVVVWIFVNPKQFGPGEDFATYPRDMERDLALLRDEGVDYVLAPTVEAMYPPGHQTTVSVPGLAAPLEGASRGGHFDGVSTIVCKMFCLVMPARAYFGQKDGQQCLVVRRMAQDLNMRTEVVICPTVREPDGLAMSSRNVYLGAAERAEAPALHRALRACEAAWRTGERDADRLRAAMMGELGSPLLQVEYLSIADAGTLEECATVDGPVMASLAVRLGRTRLIDNLLLGE